MSVDKSLKSRSRLERFRGVLSRSERIAELRDRDKWTEGQSIFGIPKVRVRRAKRRVKAAASEAAETAAVAEAPAEEQPVEGKGKEREKGKGKGKGKDKA